jgi:ketosteroid isomerase-like protein
MSARDVLKAYEDRINRQDFDLLTDLITPDATFWFSSGTFSGIAAIRAAFEATWQRMGKDEHY